MAGTPQGGKKAAQANMAKYGADFYREIGRKGGQNGHSGGFASEVVGKDGLTGRQRAHIVGVKGGKISKRGPAKKPRVEVHRATYEKKSDIDYNHLSAEYFDKRFATCKTTRECLDMHYYLKKHISSGWHSTILASYRRQMMKIAGGMA